VVAADRRVHRANLPSGWSRSKPHRSWLLGLFAALSALEAHAGWLLWNGERLGALMTAGLLPVEVVFWAGFAVPIPPLFAIARVGFLAAGWSSLR
jgi:hypothetical protein